MNTTCPACGRQCGNYDLCPRQHGLEYRYRVCLACCRDEHQPTDKADET